MTPVARLAWRALLLIAMTLYFAAAALVSRGLIGGFGWSVASVAEVAVAALCSGVILLPMAMLVDLPLALSDHWIPERRWRAGRCPGCGYGPQRSTQCPECGAPLIQPAPYASGWRTLRRAAAVAMPAWVVGTAIGVLLFSSDEARFVREVAATRAQEPTLRSYARARAAPASFALLQWNEQTGFDSAPPFETPKIRVRAP